MRVRSNDRIPCWEDMEPRPIHEVAQAFAREAITRSPVIDGERCEVQRLLDQLRSDGGDAELIAALDRVIAHLDADLTDLAVAVGVETERHVRLKPLFREVVLHLPTQECNPPRFSKRVRAEGQAER